MAISLKTWILPRVFLLGKWYYLADCSSPKCRRCSWHLSFHTSNLSAGFMNSSLRTYPKSLSLGHQSYFACITDLAQILSLLFPPVYFLSSPLPTKPEWWHEEVEVGIPPFLSLQKPPVMVECSSWCDFPVAPLAVGPLWAGSALFFEGISLSH